MFVTFNSDAYEHITYFNEVATRLITLMGHSATVPGAIKASDLSDALNNLQQGISRDKTMSASDNGNDYDDAEISLAKRAVPLINLLHASIKKECDVLWVSSKSPDKV